MPIFSPHTYTSVWLSGGLSRISDYLRRNEYIDSKLEFFPTYQSITTLHSFSSRIQCTKCTSNLLFMAQMQVLTSFICSIFSSRHIKYKKINIQILFIRKIVHNKFLFFFVNWKKCTYINLYFANLKINDKVLHFC